MTRAPALLFPTMLLPACHAAVLHPGHGRSIDRLIFFGDSFTDQSREHSISNGSYPGKDYTEVFPSADVAANGGISWP